ncbi:MAG: hypothetical protein ACFFBD_02225 [Candidatus Hodarchaeota archaeon]
MRKNLFERVQAIFELLEQADDYVHKTTFSEVGLDSNSAEQWIKIIEFIQSKPKINVQRLGNYTTVKLEQPEKESNKS